MGLPRIDVSPENLYRMCYASVQTSLLLTAVNLGVFTLLSTPKTADRVAADIHGHPRNTRLFLNGLAACGLLDKKNGVYTNTPEAAAFLVEGSDSDLGKGFVRQAESFGLAFQDLSPLVLEGPAAYIPDHDASDEKEWAKTAVWMANNQRAGVARQMSKIVSELPEFPLFTKMLDLGAGPGMFGIAIVDRHPAMTGVVFDRAPVVRVAERFIREYGMEDRITGLAGDYNTDPIGHGYDLIWASSTLNFAQDNLDAVMAKIRNALAPDGVFASLSEGLTHEGTKPDFYVLCTLMWAMRNPLSPFDQGVIAHGMERAGFKRVTSRTIQTGWGPMDLDVARK